MATKSPIIHQQQQQQQQQVEIGEEEEEEDEEEEELSRPSTETTNQQQQQQQQPQLESSSPNNPITPTPTPTLTSDIPPVIQSKETPQPITTLISRPPPEPSSTDAHLIHLPSYSRWFSWNNIHECEVRFLPEFFDARSPSKNPRVYKYYRNSIIRRFRENPNPNSNPNQNPNPNPNPTTRKISFTEARKTIIGDVGSVRRVFDFLEAWGLINYSSSSSSSSSSSKQQQQLKWEDKDTKSIVASSQTGELAAAAATSASFSTPKKRICSGCKSVCSIACFSCDKHELTLCARCYVRGNYQVGVNSTDFRRVEINEEIKTDWTDKDTLQLLEAVLHYGDDWKKVAEYVAGRSETECVARFIKLPFTEQFLATPDSAEVANNYYYQTKFQSNADFGSQNFALSSSTKRVRLTPLADASNPIMAQAAFLSALVGVEVAEAAAGAAVRALSDVNNGLIKERDGSFTSGAREREPGVASNVDTTLNTPLEVADADVQLQLEKEEQNLERAISDLTEVKTKEIQDKILHFEEFELRMEREWQQLQEMKNLLFVDQLSLLFRKAAAPKAGETMEGRSKAE